MSMKRFTITRTVIAGTGISAEIKLSAIDMTDAEARATDLFAHEESTATYTVARTRSASVRPAKGTR